MTHRFRSRAWPTFVMMLVVAVVTGACDSGTDNPNGDDTVIDHVETEHYELDLASPPSRDDVGLSDDAVGLSVYFEDEPQRTFDADIGLPDDVVLSLQPRLVAIDTSVGRDRPRDLTPQTAPPGHVGAQFSFDDPEGLRAFLIDLAGQLGKHAGGLTPEYIDDAVTRRANPVDSRGSSPSRSATWNCRSSPGRPAMAS